MTLTVAILIGALVGSIVGGGSYLLFKRIYQKEYRKTSEQPSSPTNEIAKSQVGKGNVLPQTPPKEYPTAEEIADTVRKRLALKQTPTQTNMDPPAFREKIESVSFSLGNGFIVDAHAKSHSLTMA
ncbi:MAG: hypothetical protein HY896_01130 [Deltaproteobacteria bacterium]|nr:hypothetical protein [Deltaproteobacteria bacterium]